MCYSLSAFSSYLQRHGRIFYYIVLFCWELKYLKVQTFDNWQGPLRQIIESQYVQVDSHNLEPKSSIHLTE